jgi:quercetin 2,3-dioxygenase
MQPLPRSCFSRAAWFNFNPEIPILNGQPIDEPVVSHGPFVMNTPQEIRQAIED